MTPTSFDPQQGRYVAAFVPYLHYETQKNFKEMATTVRRALKEMAIAS